MIGPREEDDRPDAVLGALLPGALVNGRSALTDWGDPAIVRTDCPVTRMSWAWTLKIRSEPVTARTPRAP